MKTRKFLFSLIAILTVLFFMACESDNEPKDADYGILPSKFKVDIPSSISDSDLKSENLKSLRRNDTLQGREIYQHLKFFIAIGEGAADIVEAIIFHIRLYNIEDVILLTYTSDEDGRVKSLEVVSNVEFQGVTWEYMLTITDVESEGNDDGGIGMQVFWNNNPIKGIALIKPYNLNRKDHETGSAMFSIEYSAAGMGDYEEYMIVGIAGMPLPDSAVDRFGLRAMKMFVGRNGDIVDVYGNSNHPNAKFFTDSVGFNWAFVASGNRAEDIAVAEVGLPPSNLDATDRETILEEYSIKNVFTEQVNEWVYKVWGVYPDSATVAGYLVNTEAPGYFDANGFIQGGIAPNAEYTEIEGKIEALVPYNPIEISTMVIDFKR